VAADWRSTHAPLHRVRPPVHPHPTPWQPSAPLSGAPPPGPLAAPPPDPPAPLEKSRPCGEQLATATPSTTVSPTDARPNGNHMTDLLLARDERGYAELAPS